MCGCCRSGGGLLPARGGTTSAPGGVAPTEPSSLSLVPASRSPPHWYTRSSLTTVLPVECLEWSSSTVTVLLRLSKFPIPFSISGMRMSFCWVGSPLLSDPLIAPPILLAGGLTTYIRLRLLPGRLAILGGDWGFMGGDWGFMGRDWGSVA